MSILTENTLVRMTKAQRAKMLEIAKARRCTPSELIRTLIDNCTVRSGALVARAPGVALDSVEELAEGPSHRGSFQTA